MLGQKRAWQLPMVWCMHFQTQSASSQKVIRWSRFSPPVRRLHALFLEQKLQAAARWCRLAFPLSRYTEWSESSSAQKKEVQRAEWREDFGRWRRRRRRKVVLNFITVFKTSRSSRAKEHRRWKLNEEEKWKVVTKLENDFNYYKRKRDAMKIEGNCISAAAACCSHISCTMTERRCCCFGRVEETSHRTKKKHRTIPEISLSHEQVVWWALKKMPKLSFYDDYDYNEQITIIVLRWSARKKSTTTARRERSELRWNVDWRWVFDLLEADRRARESGSVVKKRAAHK